MKEIVLIDVDSYKFLLLMSGFVISIFYDVQIINPGQVVILVSRIEKESNEKVEVKCRCVSHNHNRLVLV